MEALEAVTEHTPLIRGETVAAELDSLYERNIQCLDRAEESGDIRLYLQAIRETRSTIELEWDKGTGPEFNPAISDSS